MNFEEEQPVRRLTSKEQRKLPADHWRRRHKKLQPGQKSPWQADVGANRSHPKLDDIEAARLVDMWRTNPGISYERIAEEFKISTFTVNHYLRRFDQDITTRGVDFEKALRRRSRKPKEKKIEEPIIEPTPAAPSFDPTLTYGLPRPMKFDTE